MHAIGRTGRRLAGLTLLLTLAAGLAGTAAMAAGNKADVLRPGPTVPDSGRAKMAARAGGGAEGPRPMIVTPDGTIIDIILIGRPEHDEN